MLRPQLENTRLQVVCNWCFGIPIFKIVARRIRLRCYSVQTPGIWESRNPFALLELENGTWVAAWGGDARLSLPAGWSLGGELINAFQVQTGM